MQICDKVALVTGGASGLGRAVVELLIAQQAKPYIVDLPTDKAKKDASLLGVPFLPLDVTSESQVKEALNTMTNSSEIPSILINCAGVAIAGLTYSKKGPHPYEAFKRTVDVNLVGVFNMIRIVSGIMAENIPEADGERGVIINTASIAATDGQKGQTAYASSKAAVLGLTLPLARDLAEMGIRVNTICPGIFSTPMIQEVNPKIKAKLAQEVVFPKRLGRPEEFAQLVKFLIECPYINGEAIRLDGGLRMV